MSIIVIQMLHVLTPLGLLSAHATEDIQEMALAVQVRKIHSHFGINKTSVRRINTVLQKLQSEIQGPSFKQRVT